MKIASKYQFNDENMNENLRARLFTFEISSSSFIKKEEEISKRERKSTTK